MPLKTLSIQVSKWKNEYKRQTIVPMGGGPDQSALCIVSNVQPEVITSGLQLAEGKGSGGETLKDLTAVGEGPVNSVKHASGEDEVKKKDGAVREAPKHGRFRITKPDEGESCSVHQHCTQREVLKGSPLVQPWTC